MSKYKFYVKKHWKDFQKTAKKMGAYGASSGVYLSSTSKSVTIIGNHGAFTRAMDEEEAEIFGKVSVHLTIDQLVTILNHPKKGQLGPYIVISEEGTNKTTGHDEIGDFSHYRFEYSDGFFDTPICVDSVNPTWRTITANVNRKMEPHSKRVYVTNVNAGKLKALMAQYHDEENLCLMYCENSRALLVSSKLGDEGMPVESGNNGIVMPMTTEKLRSCFGRD